MRLQAYNLYADALVACRKQAAQEDLGKRASAAGVRAERSWGLGHHSVQEEEVHFMYGKAHFESAVKGQATGFVGAQGVGTGTQDGAGLLAAARAFNAALEANSMHLASLEALALLHDTQGRTSQAHMMYLRAERAAEKQPGAGGMSLEGLTNFGGFLDALGDTAKAHKCLVAALKIDASHVPALVNLATLISRSTTSAATRSAERLWSRALAVLREKWKRTEMRRDRGVTDEAALTMLESELKDVTCWCLEGMAWLRCKRRGDVAGAVKLLQAAKTMAPNKESAHSIASALAAAESQQRGTAYEGTSAGSFGGTGENDKQQDALRRLEEPTLAGVGKDGEIGMQQTEISLPTVAGKTDRDVDAARDAPVGVRRSRTRPGEASEELEQAERASSPPVEVNNLAFIAGKLRRRMSHVLDSVSTPRGYGRDALSAGSDMKGLIGTLLQAARDVTGTRIIDTPPPPPRDPEPVLQAHGTSDDVFARRASPRLDLEDSNAELSTVFDVMPSVPSAELGRSEPLPPPEPGDAHFTIGDNGLPKVDSEGSSAAYHPGFLRSSEVFRVQPSEPDSLYMNGELYSSDSMDRLSSKVEWESERERRQARRELRRTPRELRKKDPARREIVLPRPPPEVCLNASDTQFILPRENPYEERERLRERERTRRSHGRAATPALRVASPEIGCVAQNLPLVSKGLKVCIESRPGGKVIAAGLLVVIGRDFVIKYHGSCMSPFKFLRGLGLNATAEEVGRRIVLLKTRKPVFAHLGVTVSPTTPSFARTALDSSEMAPDSSLMAAGYVAPALDPARFEGTHGWKMLQRVAGSAAEDAAGGAVTPPPTREMPSPPPAVANVRAVHAALRNVVQVDTVNASEAIPFAAGVDHTEFENPREIVSDELESPFSETAVVNEHGLEETTLARELDAASQMGVMPWERGTNLTERVSSPSLPAESDDNLEGGAGANAQDENAAKGDVLLPAEGREAALVDVAGEGAQQEAIQNNSNTDARMVGGDVKHATLPGGGNTVVTQGGAAVDREPKGRKTGRVKEKVGRIDTVSVGCQYYLR